MENVKLKAGFYQVCIWEGTSLREDSSEEFVKFMDNEYKVRVQFLEEVTTLPDVDRRGILIDETGGRTDIVFAVHTADVKRFAISRIKSGIRWIEDVFGNGNGHRYPKRFEEYRCWDYKK